MKRIYRFLLHFYPARFREEFASAMERQFQDEYRDSGGGAGFWLRAFADLAASIPGQILRELRSDATYAVHVYCRRPLVTALALTALALAIGATTGVFSVLNAVLLRSLPFREPERVVQVNKSPVDTGAGRAKFYDWRDHNPLLEQVAGFSVNEMNLALARDSARVKVAETSANFFATLGVEPEFGRGFAKDEDVEGRGAVAVLSHALWQEAFGSNPRALGSTLRLNGAPLTVIGVAPPGFDYPDKTSVWTPTIFDLGRLPKGGAFFWQTIGRIRKGLSFRQANAMLRTEEARLRPASAKKAAPPGFRPVEGESASLKSLRDQLAGPVRDASLVLMGIVLFVLLIACANVAHLLLSRVSERRQELTIRAAMGATRARLAQQLITESLLMTILAAGAGLLVAQWAARLAESAQPATLSAQQYSVLDWRVLAFAAGLAIFTGLLFGVVPAWLAGRMQPSADALRAQGAPQNSGAGRMRMALIAMQAAFTVALLAGALTLGRGFLKLLGTDLGFRTDHVVTLNVSLAGTRWDTDTCCGAYYAAALERLRAVPGVESAGLAGYLPLIRYSIFMGGATELDSGQKGPVASLNSASPGYFQTMRAELVAGRDFTPADGAPGARVAIVTEDVARAFGPGPIAGRRLKFWGWSTVVGVVRSQRGNGPARGISGEVYLPVEHSTTGFATFVARVRGKTEAYLPVCRDAVRQVDPSVPVYDVKTLDRRLADNLARPRFYATAILFFGGFALLLAIIGVYGVAAYGVAQRTHEIGVRIAVGAAPSALRLAILRLNLAPMVLGMAVGTAAAVGMGRYLQHLAGAAEPAGAGTGAAGAAILAATAVAAVWSATRAVTLLDPMAALKAE